MAGPPGVQDIQARLVAIGMDADLASTYLHLLVHGTSRPAGAATALRVSRVEAQQRIQRLCREEMAHLVQERPAEYAPAEPADVFEVLHQRDAMQAQAVKQAEEDLRPLFASLTASCIPTGGTTFRQLTGRATLYEELHRLLDDARQEVLMASLHPAAAEIAQDMGLWERVQELAEADIRHHIVMADSPALRQRHETNVRVAPPGPVLRFAIVDRKTILLGMATDASTAWDAPLEKGLVTQAPGFLSTYQALFWRLWEESQPVAVASEAEQSWRR